MKDDRNWELIAKYFSGEASDQEIERLKKWIDSDPARVELFENVLQAWKATEKNDASRVDVSAAWRKLEDRMDEEADSKRASRHESRSPRRGSRSTRRRLLRVGGCIAVILVAALIIRLWESSESKVLTTARGERAAIELVDDTHVDLNAESRLVLLEGFGRDKREVYLEGEAYFDVAHDKSHPFLIHTSEGTIRVVGTAFDVRAYAGEGEARVAVTEGAVALPLKKSTQTTKTDTVVLRPHELGVITGQRLRARHRNVDLTSHLAWREGRLVFENTPFQEVVRDLERWYDLQIEVRARFASIDRLNAVFEEESASEVIGDIAVALDLQYKKEGQRVTFY